MLVKMLKWSVKSVSVLGSGVFVIQKDVNSIDHYLLCNAIASIARHCNRCFRSTFIRGSEMKAFYRHFIVNAGRFATFK